MKGNTAKQHVFQALQGQTSCFSANGKHMSLLAHLIPRFEMSRGTKQAESCIPSVCGIINLGMAHGPNLWSNWYP